MLPVQQQNTASTATKTRFDLLIENAPQACAALRAGRRGRRFKSCHPDQYSRRPEALPLPGWGLRFCPYRNEVPQRCSLTALRSDSPSLRSASLVASMPQLADSKAAIQINVLHAPFGLENEGGSGPG